MWLVKIFMNTENLAVVIGGTGSIGGAISEQIRSLGFKEIIKTVSYTHLTLPTILLV